MMRNMCCPSASGYGRNLRGRSANRPYCRTNESPAVLMEKIAQCEFICVDINLYLDTHPNDEQALADYNCYARQLAALKAMFEDNYGPLENFGNAQTGKDAPFAWAMQPWPWSPLRAKED